LGKRALNLQKIARIAVIDDDIAVREATGRLLRSLGYDVATFESAEHFLRSACHEWACLITDVRMVGMSGVDLQAELITAGHRMPIIFMTAFPEENIRSRALSAGAHAFLTKPCREQSLVDCIESALRPRAAHPQATGGS
jgi:FixJ family two-component response regulator